MDIVMGKVLEADIFEEWRAAVQRETDKEVALYTQEDWEETIKYLLGDCPAKIEAALLALHLEARMDPTNENLGAARRWLTWALKDIVKAKMIAQRRL